MKLSQLIYSTLLRLDNLLPSEVNSPDWLAKAFRFIRVGNRGNLQPIKNPHTFSPNKIVGVDYQKKQFISNTEQFIQGRSANNILLSGARGTGKSSLIKSLIDQYSKQGLRLIEVDKTDLLALPFLLELLANRAEKFILFCDDLSFTENDDSFKSLKRVLDGGLSIKADNVLIYATSNKRHLINEKLADNDFNNEDLFPQDSIEEKTSLSDRFGIWLHFYPFSQEQYLMAVKSWLDTYHITFDDTAMKAAIQWASIRGNRSGRVAWQFSQDWVGKLPEQRVFIQH